MHHHRFYFLLVEDIMHACMHACMHSFSYIPPVTTLSVLPSPTCPSPVLHRRCMCTTQCICSHVHLHILKDQSHILLCSYFLPMRVDFSLANLFFVCFCLPGFAESRRPKCCTSGVDALGGICSCGFVCRLRALVFTEGKLREILCDHHGFFFFIFLSIIAEV